MIHPTRLWDLIRGASPQSASECQAADNIFRSFAEGLERRLAHDQKPGPKVRLPVGDDLGRAW